MSEIPPQIQLMNDARKAKGITGGRPLKFRSVKALEVLIDQYFDNCQDIDKIPTITGLAVALDTDRRTLIEYTERPEFTNAIKRAKARIEAELESAALNNKTNAAVSIFSLKNNYGWHDKLDIQSTSLNANVEVSLEAVQDYADYLKRTT